MNRLVMTIFGFVSVALLASLLLSGCDLLTASSDSETKEAREPEASQSIIRTARKGPVTFKVTLSPKAPKLSDTVRLKLQIMAQPNVETFAPVFGEAVSGFIVRDYLEKKPRIEDGKTIRTFIYKLEPPHAGKHLIRALEISFLDKRKRSEAKGKKMYLELEPIEFEVSSEFAGKVPDLSDLATMDPPRPMAARGLLHNRWVWLSAGVLLVGFGLAFYFFKKKDPLDLKIPKRSPEEIAYEELARLRDQKLAEQGRFVDFYVGLTGIVRRYIERTTGIDAPDQTTEEFLAAMRNDVRFTRSKAGQLEAFLAASDLVKYAAMQPEVDDLEGAFSLAAQFVTKGGLGIAE